MQILGKAQITQPGPGFSPMSHDLRIMQGHVSRIHLTMFVSDSDQVSQIISQVKAAKATEPRARLTDRDHKARQPQHQYLQDLEHGVV